MEIWVDTREKPKAIKGILAEFDRQGLTVVRKALKFADYWNPDNPKVIIDRKMNLSEVCFNVTSDRPRFVREIERCNKAGCHMIVLVEHGGRIRKLEDVLNWANPRLKVAPLSVSGVRLFKIMKAMSLYYNFEWQFCNKQSTGKRIIELLGGEMDE